jgi:hypothetical protein
VNWGAERASLGSPRSIGLVDGMQSSRGPMSSADRKESLRLGTVMQLLVPN